MCLAVLELLMSSCFGLTEADYDIKKLKNALGRRIKTRPALAYPYRQVRCKQPQVKMVWGGEGLHTNTTAFMEGGTRIPSTLLYLMLARTGAG